jgi:hypothetical protein
MEPSSPRRRAHHHRRRRLGTRSWRAACASGLLGPPSFTPRAHRGGRGLPRRRLRSDATFGACRSAGPVCRPHRGDHRRAVERCAAWPEPCLIAGSVGRPGGS